MSIKTFKKSILDALGTSRLFIYKLIPRAGRYSGLFVLLNTFIWTIAVFTATVLPERYESKWALILPGAGVGGRIDIDNIGSASAIVNSGFSSRNLSPKVNYKSIAQSSKVRKVAASSVGMALTDFGMPQIKMVDQTSMLFLSMSSPDPEIAQKKSWALYNSIQAEISRLRQDEISRREQGIQEMLKTFSQKLNEAKAKLLDYQAQSNITTIDQFKRIPLLIEDMRINLLDMTAQKEQVFQEMMSLHRILGLTSKQASMLMSLQADPLLAVLLKNQSEASSKLAEYSNKFGKNNQKVKQQQFAYDSSTAAIKARTQEVVGENDWLKNMPLTNNLQRNELMQNLILKKISYEGYKSKIKQIKKQIESYQKRIQEQTKNVSKLDELEREHHLPHTQCYSYLWSPLYLIKLVEQRPYMFISVLVLAVLSH